VGLAPGRPIRALIIIHCAMAAGFALLLIRHLSDPHRIVATDFTAFYTGWHLILDGRGAALYDVAAQRAAQHAIMGEFRFPGGLLAFLHPPPAAVAGIPFGIVAMRFGEPAAFWCWTALNLVLLADLVRRLGRLVAPELTSRRVLFTTSVLAFYPVFLTLWEGQVGLLLAVALCRLYLATRERRQAAAAAWLVVLCIKPYLLPIPLALLISFRRYRTIAIAAAFAAVAAAITAAVLGPGIFGSYFRALGSLQAHLGNGTPAGMVNLRGLIARLSGGDGGAPGALTALAPCVLAAVALAAFWGRRPSEARLANAFASGFAAAIWLSPHLFVHDLALWVVPLAIAASTFPPRSLPGARFERFALAWPLVFGATFAIVAWPRFFFETAALLSIVALVTILRADSLARAAERGGDSGPRGSRELSGTD
jgi:alpha-1,2-mannosyltransferase